METAPNGSVERARPPWYAKCYEYLRNRNRVSPGEIVIPNSEFFNAGPRRNLRIARPPPRDMVYYENTNHDRPQSVNDNFFSRWSRRPHPSGNCRCSYRRSGRHSTTEEQIISNEIQRIRTSLCEAEKGGHDNIREVEQSVYQKLENLRASPQNPIPPSNPPIDEQATKEKIVKDLEQYINGLLEEILNDTAHILSGMDSPFRNIKNPATGSRAVKFSCYNKDERVPPTKDGEGYVNRGFVESDCDPETLNFHCPNSEANADYVDSGINSVETVELQVEQPSLEQSLMAIIDSKLGENTLDKSLEDLNMEIAEYAENSEGSVEKPTANKECGSKEMGQRDSVERKKVRDKDLETKGINGKKEMDLSDTMERKFTNTRLEFTEEEGATCTRNVAVKMNRTVSALREKIVTSLSLKKSQENREKSTKPQHVELGSVNKCSEVEELKESVDSAVVMRKNRKPMIVFLHGFGSSAETFEHQLRYFSSLGYPCIAPDMLGHGFSSAPNKSRDYHFDRLLKDVDMILNQYALKPGQKCVLVGHNYGCSFATSLAAKYESQISQLILISGGGPTPLAPPSSEGIGHCFLRAMLAPLLMCGLHRDILYSARGRQHPYCGPGTSQEWPSHMKYILKGMVWPNGDYAFHRRICTPTLLIHGLRDNSVSLVQECQMERTMIKALLEAIPTAGHTPMTDCPDQLNHMIHCFIDLWKNKR